MLLSYFTYVSHNNGVPIVADPFGMVMSLFCRDIHVEFLQSNAMPPGDHSMMGETYSRRLERLGKEFINHHLKNRRAM
jgi:hypothetical protein